ncbi:MULTISPECIES: hypothetical protein [Agrobacterium]|uniref:hypothetical protein n=1 Tax=Agrobacterium TaxID=357 RepID=UPI000745A0E1|nr:MULTISPECIES: hypothetical protein [Agrobacterium]KVK61189.1 hypothetical protein L906_22125 [Agrobacterium sp. TS45]KVK66319.1 hypothetical protein L907_22085 [Agrobacterium sp. C13]
MDERDVGTIGENQFLSWCQPEGFRAQKSAVDRLGWDFLLERDPARALDRPLDGQNELAKFLVQVKSTDRAGEAPRIKLSALKHLVDADLPAAIAVLEFGGGSRLPTRNLIVPVDEVIIHKTLRRARKEEARGNRKLHKITVPVPVDRAIELGNAGEGLSTALDAMLGGGPYSDYIKTKINQRQTCGFQDGAVVGRFFVPGEDARDKIHNLFLGKRRVIDVEHLTVERRRFGIALDNDTDFFRSAVLEFDAPPLMAASIELEDIEDGSWTRFRVNTYVVPPFVEGGEKAPIRLANNFFEVNLDFENERADIFFDYDGSRSVGLDEAVTIIEVGAILARPKKKLKIEIGSATLELPVAEGDEGPFRNWIPAAPMLRRMVSAIERHNRTSEPRLILADFYDWIEQRQALLALGSTPGANLFIPRWEEDGIVDSQDTLLAPLTLELAGAQYTTLIEVPIETIERGDREFSIIGGQPRVVDDIARAVGASTEDFIDRTVGRSKRERRATGPALVAAAFENWAIGSTLSPAREL